MSEESTSTEEQSSKSFLDARISAEKLRDLYINDTRQNSFRALILGESGTGKSEILRTARLPLHIDSFDPGGTIHLRDLVRDGWASIDTQYEMEDREAPSMYREWVRNFETRRRARYFEHIGTYCLDSTTMWNDAIMNHVLSTAKDKSGKIVSRAGTAPLFTHDYVPHKVQIQNSMKKILSLPCDVVVTGHIEPDIKKQLVGGEIIEVMDGYRYLTTGQGVIIIPLMFDEVWITTREESSGGIKYQLITNKYKMYEGKTRIGSKKFSTLEEPHIKKLLKKAGWPTDDKPKLF